MLALTAPLALLLAGPAWAQDSGELYVQLPAGQSGVISVDGTSTGVQAPGTVTGLSSGEHRIQVNGDCVSASQTVRVDSGEITRVELDLKPLGGFAEVQVAPVDAVVTLDGQPLAVPGMVPLPCGTHQLQATADGYRPLDQQIEVEMGGAYRFDLALELQGLGTVQVQVQPADAQLYLDGQKQSGTTLTNVSPGLHTVGASADGVAPREVQVEVRPDELLVVELDLTQTSEAGSTGTAGVADVAEPIELGDPVELNERNLAPVLGGGGLMAVGVGLVAVGAVSRAQTYSAYQQDYLAFDDDGDGEIEIEFETQAQRYYEDTIAPANRRSTVFMAAGGAALVAGAGVIVFVDDGGAVLGVSGRF